MTMTVLDPKSALIVIDLQKGVVSLPAAHSLESIVQRAAALAESFRVHNLPVVLVNVAGSAPGRREQAPSFRDPPSDWADLIPELNRQPQDHVAYSGGLHEHKP